eukprot:GILI01023948.1.p1 GENE.GILI01023948.1~~GILI01023948.1.p1  ORF type:complete len:228 (-),score=24.43 GILI01023948.1:153-836(-)
MDNSSSFPPSPTNKQRSVLFGPDNDDLEVDADGIPTNLNEPWKFSPRKVGVKVLVQPSVYHRAEEDIQTPYGRYLSLCREHKVAPNSAVRTLFNMTPFAAEVNFRHNYLGDRGIVPVVEALLLNDQLRTLDISGNGIRDAGIIAVCHRLQKHPSLTVLDLSGNEITVEGGGVKAIYDLIQRNSSIYSVVMNNSRVPEEHRQRIVAHLERNSRNAPKNSKNEASAASI